MNFMNPLKTDLQYSVEVYPLGWLLCSPPRHRGVPMNALSDCLPLFETVEKAVIDAGVARALGAAIAVGSAPNMDRWRKQITDALEAQDIPKELKWLRGVNVGQSCLALFLHLTRDNPDHRQAFGEAAHDNDASKEIPRDAGDFQRCVKMIEYLGWKDRLVEASAISPAWASVVANWDNLCVLLKIENRAGVTTFLQKVGEL